MYQEGLSIHRNGFAMTFAILNFVPKVPGLFNLFVRTTSIVLEDRRIFDLIINLASLHSTKKIVESLNHVV